MKEVLYATGNNVKFQQAQEVCVAAGIKLIQHGLNVPEIQSEEAEPIALDKAKKAYQLFKQPLVVSDDSWSIPALNGFPGAYMKSMNHWFTAEDWLRLTAGLTDRRIFVTQIAVYYDQTGPQLFSSSIEGLLLTDARGVSPHPHSSVTSFDGGQHSTAEFHERGESAASQIRSVWHDFAEWYGTHHKQ